MISAIYIEKSWLVTIATLSLMAKLEILLPVYPESPPSTSNAQVEPPSIDTFRSTSLLSGTRTSTHTKRDSRIRTCGVRCHEPSRRRLSRA